MTISEVRLYLQDSDEGQIESSNVSRSSSKYPPQQDQMTMFPEYRDGDWMSGGGGYERFVVELETADGATGFAVNESGGEHAARLVDRHYRRFVEGADPWEINRVWEQMYRAQLPTGQGFLTHNAMAGVELAMWDLLGNITGQPVYNLLGGQVRDEIECYVTAYPEVMEHFGDEGFLGVKLPVHHGPSDGRAGIDAVEEMVRDAREVFGEEAEVMIEAYMAWDREFTVRVADRLAGYGVKWIEDPLLPGHTTDQYRDIRRSIKPIQLAVGNLEWGHKAFHDLIENDAGDVIQPDVSWTGGLTETKRIAAMAKPNGLPVIPHYTTPYTCHFIASCAESPFGEYMGGYHTGVEPNIPVIDGEPLPEDGVIHLNDDPGFGVELDRVTVVPLDEA
ncbi:enolase C-terminal domain-like protein [Salinigranum salinum]|uniref:enolase C-terminal domain-like protein n=1 Tax=Salinigranum salinum TaxID=1364937 RepID=UPI0012607A74|nr:enolase C-terminal domain-like protein [Salinigranum salinum]